MVLLLLAITTIVVANGDKASLNLELEKRLIAYGNSSRAIEALSANFYLATSSISAPQLAQTSFLTASAFLQSTNFFANQAANFYLDRTLDIVPHLGIAQQKISELMLRTNTNLAGAIHPARRAFDLSVERTSWPQGDGWCHGSKQPS